MDTRRRQLEVGFELDPLNHSSAVFSFRKTLTSAPTVEAKLANTWEASNSPSVTTATLIATRANTLLNPDVMTATSPTERVLVTSRLSMKSATPSHSLESASNPLIARRTSSTVTTPNARMMNNEGSSNFSSTGTNVSLP